MFCRICGHQGLREIIAKEMHIGTRERFLYQECEKCGCVQIQEFPKDIEKYYPAEYFSYRPPNTGGKWRDFIDSRRLRFALTTEGLVGRIIETFSKNLTYAEWIKITAINLDARILDVGCGAGKFLFQLRHGGFKDLTGIDPFVEKDLFYENGVKVFKADLEEFSSESCKKFDLIIFNNSFEHMFYPLEVLGQAKSILDDNGWIVIVTPVADSEEWEKYRENWANLDAPRHFFLHTSKSLQILCDSLELVMHKALSFGSEGSQVNSELYQKNIPLISQKREKKKIMKKDGDFYKRKLRKSISSGRGPLSVFFLKKGEKPLRY